MAHAALNSAHKVMRSCSELGINGAVRSNG